MAATPQIGRKLAHKRRKGNLSKEIASLVSPLIVTYIQEDLDIRQHSLEVLRLMADSLVSRLQSETNAMLHSLKAQGKAKQMKKEAEQSVMPPLTGAQILAQWDAAGMGDAWAQRTDIDDSSAYASALRERSQRRELGR